MTEDEFSRLTYDHRMAYACKVCDNVPDADGGIEHGKGCFRLSEDGGGYEIIDFERLPMPTITYREALATAILALREYRGEEVPPHEGDGEHPLHVAIRNVEAHCPANGRGKRPLWVTAWATWNRLLLYSREMDETRAARGSRFFGCYATSARQPELAREAGVKLLAMFEDQYQSGSELPPAV